MFPFMFYYVVTKTDTVTATSLLTRTYTNTLVGLSLVWLERGAQEDLTWSLQHGLLPTERRFLPTETSVHADMSC